MFNIHHTKGPFTIHCICRILIAFLHVFSGSFHMFVSRPIPLTYAQQLVNGGAKRIWFELETVAYRWLRRRQNTHPLALCTRNVRHWLDPKSISIQIPLWLFLAALGFIIHTVTIDLRHRYSESFITTIGIDYKYKFINLSGRNLRLEVWMMLYFVCSCWIWHAQVLLHLFKIWDTSGQERFKAVTRSYLRGAKVM